MTNEKIRFHVWELCVGVISLNTAQYTIYTCVYIVHNASNNSIQQKFQKKNEDDDDEKKPTRRIIIIIRM